MKKTVSRTRQPEEMRARLAQHYEALVEMAFHAMARLNADADPEALHDLRVSLRSQRVLLVAFRGRASVAEASGRLAEAARLSNAVRDLEVSLVWADSLLAETGVGAEARQSLAEQLAGARAELMAGLQHARLDEALVDAELAWFKALNRIRRKALLQRVRRRALRLSTRMNKACLALPKEGAALSDWHPVRLLGKRLRYWVEGFSECLPRGQRRLAKPLRFLQLSLGNLQDLAVLQGRLAEGDAPPAEWLTAIGRHQAKSECAAVKVLAELKPQLAKARRRH
ncbi:CHAD domain-containing protein [Crenobacter cavernae]|uniref:CHAD domain-containing protein n=1 Tax=Crenobacter cavernae TaxID=2290923 RepID=A0A345Y9I3_9NEIS|nr:CHAD domain-containing protein [Crenobacter cavernae]AXK40585.1 CHAD domain-containing protein [Crenobacter cavernae]